MGKRTFGFWAVAALLVTSLPSWASTPAKTQTDQSPPILFLDLDGDGVQLVNLYSSQAVYWDYDEDGFGEACAWLAGRDGILGVDLNGNGILDNQRELFGAAKDPFEYLGKEDSNLDGKIDRNDPIWRTLIVWQETTRDGVPHPSENFPISKSNIVELNLKARKIDKPLQNNMVGSVSEFVSATASVSGVGYAKRSMLTVRLTCNNVNSVYRDNFKLDIRALALPDLRGAGKQPDLWIAMSIDNKGPESLLERVANLSRKEIPDLFNPENNLEYEIEEIFFRWASSYRFKPDARGPHIDARRLGVLERFMDSGFIQIGANDVEKPLYWASYQLKSAYIILYNELAARLLAQTKAKQLISGNLQYDRGELVGGTGLDRVGVNRVSHAIKQSNDLQKRRIAWRSALRLIEMSVGIMSLSKRDQDHLDKAIRHSLDQKAGLQDVYNDIMIGQVAHTGITDYAKWRIRDMVYKHYHVDLWPRYVGIVNIAALLLFFGIIGGAYAWIRYKTRGKH